METEYRFVARVKAVGTTSREGGWSLTVDWKLPGSKYDMVLYGTEDSMSLMGIGIGSSVACVISRGRLKEGKPEKYASSYFWDVESLELTQPTAPAAKAPDRIGVLRSPSEAPQIVPQRRGRVKSTGASGPHRSTPTRSGAATPNTQPVPQALCASQNHAMAFIESGILPVPEGRDPLNWLWELRDRIYRGVNMRLLMEPNFCYEHQTQMVRSETGAWNHALEDGAVCGLRYPSEYPGTVGGEPDTQSTERPEPKPEPLITAQDAHALMQKADSLLVKRADVMAYILKNHGAKQPMFLTLDQYRETLDWLESTASQEV